MADVVWNESLVSPQMRAAIKGQCGLCIWFTGLSGAGKSTLANALEVALHGQGRHTMLLDGDNVRHGLCRDLGMSLPDRSENVRRIAEVARLMTDAGIIVIAAFISPIQADRSQARQLFNQGDFFEIFVNTPLAICERRDPKGLYERARRGQLNNFTGVDSPYEPPLAAELIVDTTDKSVDELTDFILKKLQAHANARCMVSNQ